MVMINDAIGPSFNTGYMRFVSALRSTAHLPYGQMSYTPETLSAILEALFSLQRGPPVIVQID